MAHSRKDIIAIFLDLADLLESKRDVFLGCLTMVETHKTALIEFEKTVRALRSYCDELEPLEGRAPIGRVAVFLPFNTPLYSLVLYAFGPALAGNSVLVRASRLTATVVSQIWDLLEPKMGKLPLKLIRTSGEDYVDLVLRAAPVNAIIFTGNWSSVERLIPLVPYDIKLIYCGGGLSPFAILGDADLEAAVDSAIYSKSFNSGQDCLSPERFYVASDTLSAFSEMLATKVGHLRIGPLDDPDTDIGPLISREFAINIERLLDECRTVGRVICGGPIRGAVVPPTIIQAPDSASIVQTEKFAPIFAIVPFDDIEDLVQYINHPDYCMGASLYGKSVAGLSERIAAPHVTHNQSLLSLEEADAHRPFGGYRRSGFVAHRGFRHGGPLLFSIETSYHSGPINHSSETTMLGG